MAGLTCGGGPDEEDGVGDEHQQHGGVGGDVVRDGVLQAALTAGITGLRDAEEVITSAGGSTPGPWHSRGKVNVE